MPDWPVQWSKAKLRYWPASGRLWSSKSDVLALSWLFFRQATGVCVEFKTGHTKEINYRSLLSGDVRFWRRRKKTSILDGIFTIISAVIWKTNEMNWLVLFRLNSSIWLASSPDFKYASYFHRRCFWPSSITLVRLSNLLQSIIALISCTRVYLKLNVKPDCI